MANTYTIAFTSEQLAQSWPNIYNPALSHYNAHQTQYVQVQSWRSIAHGGPALQFAQ